MVAAAAKGDLTAVQRLLAAGVPVDSRDGSGRTALLAATQGNHVDVAQALIRAGANVNAQDDQLDSPYLLAGARGYLEILRLTLANGAAAVTRYDLEFYNPGAASPFQVNSLGKPNPAADGLIRVLLSTVLPSLPSTGIVYESTVSAVGPGGTGRSARSNTFIFTAPCSYSIAPTSQALGAGGGAGNATVTAGSGCGWTAASNAGWISVTSGATELLARNQVRLTRDYGYDESAVLAKEHEEETLRVALAGEIADQILRRLAAL